MYKLIKDFVAICKGQIFIFPYLNTRLLRIYGKVTVRWRRRNIIIGRNVIFLGDATILCGQDMPDDKVIIHDGVIIEHGCYLNAHGGSITLKDNSFLGVYSVIQGMGGVVIGKYSMIGPHVKIFSSDHNYSNLEIPYNIQGEESSKITVGDNVWIGAGSIILKGSSICSNSIIAAGSVVKMTCDRPSLIAMSAGFASIKKML
jgi:acetyltransferase-like isoleucine patch superfamily enzyme